MAYLSEIASIFAPEWTPDPSLLEPEDSNLIDFPDTPLQYEPGYGAAAQSRPGDVTVTFRQETLGLVLRGVDATGGEVTSAPLPPTRNIALAQQLEALHVHLGDEAEAPEAQDGEGDAVRVGEGAVRVRCVR